MLITPKHLRLMKSHLSCSLLLTAIATLWLSPVIGQTANYNEEDVPEFSLPPLLSFEDGQPVTSAQDWPQRRKELLALFESHVFGAAPKAASQYQLNAKISQLIPEFLEDRAILKEIQLNFPDGSAPEQPTLNLLLILPKSAEQSPVPVFLGLNFWGNHTIHPDPRITITKSWMRPKKDWVEQHQATEQGRGQMAHRWPVSLLIEKGYGLATLFYGDIDSDVDDQFTKGIHQVIGKPNKDQWGSIGAWAWGLSRCLDYLIDNPQVEASSVAVIGHSRLGKTALWAAAQDTRFALSISNNSGCGGAALSRREYGETVKRITTRFPYWFNSKFASYGDQVSQLPIDQHQLLALIAPRPVYVASAVKDRWADPKGEFLALQAASPAWSLFNQKGIVADTPWPKANQPIHHDVGYHLRDGKHDLTLQDWQHFITFFTQQRTKAR